MLHSHNAQKNNNPKQTQKVLIVETNAEVYQKYESHFYRIQIGWMYTSTYTTYIKHMKPLAELSRNELLITALRNK